MSGSEIYGDCIVGIRALLSSPKQVQEQVKLGYSQKQVLGESRSSPNESKSKL